VDEPNSYNILKKAGSRLGSSHSEQTKQKMSQAHQGKVKSAEIRAKMSQAKSGNNHPMFGKSHSAETLVLMSLANSKMVFVYEFNSKTKETILFKEFSSCAEAALYFDCTTRSISNYLDKDKLFRKKWILSSSLITNKE
jgi:group I intron endonuclease